MKSNRLPEDLFAHRPLGGRHQELDDKPVIEIHFEKFIPDRYLLSRLEAVMISSKKFSDLRKKGTLPDKESEGPEAVEVTEENLEDLDTKLEEMLKQMEEEEKTARDALYV